jgi:hypothetical protein
MSSNLINSWIRLQISIRDSNPNVLTGLEQWLNLELINDAQVKALAKQYLSCPLPEPVTIEATERTNLNKDFAPDVIFQTSEKIRSKQPSILNRVWQSFKDELSVRWLLFLGVFLVVVSSGVLAATQWERFLPIGQYLVLFTYTIIFWLVSFWAGKQENLSLTSQTLYIITLLLVPVNFWAMDTFGLLGYPLGWFTLAFAAFILSIITFLPHRRRERLPLILNFLSLSYLNLGWKIANWSFLAVYIGAIATAIILRFLSDRQEVITDRFTKKINESFLIYALSVLLGRAIFVVHLPIEDLGLAIGICGWLFTGLQLPQQEIRNRIFTALGVALLFFGWLVSAFQEFPWQALIISGLAIHFCAERLQKYWFRRDLLAVFLIGLQALFLIRELIPDGFRKTAISVSIQIAHSQDYPYTVLGVTFFPYVILFVALTNWLYRQDKAKVACFGEWLTLVLGIALTTISQLNPTWRSINFLLSTITLAYVTYHPTAIRLPLLYLTHIFALLTFTSTIDWQFPNLDPISWAIILIVLTAIEWGISTLSASESSSVKFWYESGWYLGFPLAFLSYILLLTKIPLPSQQTQLIWFVVPFALTAVASRSGENRRIEAASFSCLALLIAQIFTISQPGIRLVGLGIATGLMLANTYYIRKTIAAAVNLGFVLSFFVALFWGQLSEPTWFLGGSIAIIILWLLRQILLQQQGTIPVLYAQAADNWAIIITISELSLLTFHYLNFTPPDWQYLASPILIGIAIFWRMWRSIDDTQIYAIGWAAEIAVGEAITLAGASRLELAAANIILGLLTACLIYWLEKKQSRLAILAGLEFLALVYILIGILWRVEYFTASTGLITLGAAIVGVSISCRHRQREWQAITYLSIAGISLAWYELVIYQMLQASGGSPADGLTILAIVAAAIAITYRIFVWYWETKGNESFLNLTLEQIKIIAHIHWAIGSLLKLASIAIFLDSPPQLKFVSIAVNLILAAYALIQGRATETRNNNAAEWWVYVGLVEIVGTAIHARLIWTQLSAIDPWRAILASIVALIIFELPWRSLGWQPTPWHRASLVIPALTVLVTATDVSYLSLLVVAGFYGRMAIGQRNIRWSYISLVFVDWAIVRLLRQQGLIDILWYAFIIGFSLLYIAQFDPTLRDRSHRIERHYLRVIASGFICTIALLFHQDTALIPAIISLAFVFAGLGLRIRAFLFVGTITFILTTFYQLVILVFEYSFLKWVIGLIAGIILISIAANFEKRREQIITLLQNWLGQLAQWD